MTLQIPSLSQIRDRMNADLDYRLPAAQSRPAKSVLGVLTTVMSAAISSLYGFGQWITEQLDPMTCSESWLIIWGERLSIPRKSATFAQGKIQFSATTAVIIPAGTRLRHQLSGNIYTTDQTILNADDLVGITAATSGDIGNLAINSLLSLETPISGASMSVTVIVEIAGGSDKEAVSDWRNRVAAKLQERQEVGDADDYRRWATAAHPAIISAVVHGNYPSLGTISIRCLGDQQSPILDAATLSVAQKSMDSLRNVGCRVQLLPALIKPINIRIANVEEDSQSAIETEIRGLFELRVKFGAALWPEEIERLIALYTDQYSLLAPVAVSIADKHTILVMGDIEWL